MRETIRVITGGVQKASLQARASRAMRCSAGGRLTVLLLLWGMSLVPGCRREGPVAAGDDVSAGPCPNIVIYLVDTLRPDRLGLFGHDRPTSPRLDAFAADSVVFEETYSPSGWTKPAVASLLSGVNPPRHGAITRTNRLPPQVTLLGERLGNFGYHTAAMISNPNVTRTWGFDQGFESFYDVGADTQETRADEINKAIFEHMDQDPRKPFFYFVHTLDPHAPYDPPPPYERMFTDNPAPFRGPFKMNANTPEARLRHAWDKYDAEIAFNDEQFGLLLDRLKADGLYEDAMIIFVADHGEELLDHNGGGHGHTLYQELVRVPMVIKFPGNSHAGQRVRARASLIDVAPTILSYLNAEVPAELEGISLLPLVQGDGAEAPSRPMFFDLDLQRRDGTLNVAKAVLSEDYKYFEVVSPRPERMLFNVSQDPGEQANLVGSEPAKAEQLAAMLGAYTASVAGGVHLILVNRGDMLDRVYEGKLKTSGRFVGLRQYQCEQGDSAQVSADGRTLTFRAVLRNHPGVRKSKTKWVTDEDRLSVGVEPADADVTVERLVVDASEELPLFIGPERRPAGPLPLRFVPEDPSLQIAEPGALFREEGELLNEMAQGAYLVVVRSVERSDIEGMDPELRARLERLGYISAEDGEEY
ncbi:MAG: sulfatase [Phycisphaerales bacterium]|nr:MAG: sulfatase [Phycisphaerales bacterium]